MAVAEFNCQNGFNAPLAIGFGSLGMLGWLAAAAAPLLIQLWTRRKHHEAPWAAVELLLAAMRNSSRRIQVHNWLLLAMRTLLLVLVAIAVAKPHVDDRGANAPQDVRTHRMLVLDASYSMAYKGKDGTRFDRAKQIAEQIVGASRLGDGWTLVRLSDPAEAIVRRPSFAAREFLPVLTSQSPSDSGGDLSSTLRVVESTLKQIKFEHSNFKRHMVYFLTDLGATTWGVDDAASQSFVSAPEFSRISAEAEIFVIDVGEEQFQNIAVTKIATREPYVVVNRDVNIEAVVRNFGAVARRQCNVRLIEDDCSRGDVASESSDDTTAPIDARQIDVPAGGQVAVQFSHRISRPGEHVFRVDVGEDSLNVDDQRWLSVDAKPFIQALCIEGRTGEASYVAKAIAPFSNGGNTLRATIDSERALMDADFEKYDCLFLLNIARFSAGEARRLDAYLRGGGGVVYFLGDQISATNYARELANDYFDSSEKHSSGARSEGVDILPVQIGDVVSEGTYRFDPLDYRHRIVEAFRGRDNAGLLTTPVFRYHKLTLRSNMPNAEVALAFENGDPAIVVAPIFEGFVVVVATAASHLSIDPVTKSPWTAWPAWPSFLPIVRGLLASAVQGQQVDRNRLIGQAIGRQSPSEATASSVRITRPDGSTHTARVELTDSRAKWEYSPVEDRGVYLAVAENGDASDRASFAVNVNTIESDLEKTPASSIPSEVRVAKSWREFEAAPTETQFGRGVHIQLLVAALLLLLMELLFACGGVRGAR